ncbi:unnamed protein product, partial [Pylaiella littoralis]
RRWRWLGRRTGCKLEGGAHSPFRPRQELFSECGDRGDGGDGTWYAEGVGDRRSGSSGSSDGDGDDSDEELNATRGGVPTYPFDPGKCCLRSAGRGDVIRALAHPFDPGKSLGRFQHGG